MAFNDRSRDWFLAQLKPNCANIANRNLERQGFQTFLPQEEHTLRRRGKFVTAIRPLFPGYIFVAFDAKLGLWSSINSTHGITRLVTFGKEPASVPTGLVSQLMMRCDSQSKLKTQDGLKAGDQVRFANGPFTDFVGCVEKIAPDQRVWLLMELMGSQKRVAVEKSQLRAI